MKHLLLMVVRSLRVEAVMSIALLFLFAVPLCAQNPGAKAENPLAQLEEQVKQVLAGAGMPFTDAQEEAIILMMEDRRNASEELFGSLMDFRSGPTQGQEADRLNSAIEWMRTEFLARLRDYLTPEQLAAWSRSLEVATAASAQPEETPRNEQRNQTQYVRINNNLFTAENNEYNTRGTPAPTSEVIQRGGGGSFHGNGQFLLKDDRLNAGKRFASNKPPYNEKQGSFLISGPLIPGRLTSDFSFSHDEAKNVDTIRATLPDSIFALGITRPAVTRSYSARNTIQLSSAHSLSVNGGYQSNSSTNQGVGGFVLPERAYESRGSTWNVEVKQFSSLSAQAIYETRYKVSANSDRATPFTEGTRINVLDAFNSGGAQNKLESSGRIHEFGNLYTRLGEKLTLKLGSEGFYRSDRSRSENNFLGTFTFSSLEAYHQGQPLNFRINRGDPLLEAGQWELGFFTQHDWKVTPRLSVMYGLRYETQTNLRDRNNFDPRLGIAHAIGKAAVFRGGVGVFHQRVALNVIELQRRLNGTHQYEIVIDRPSYPDPFQSGKVNPITVRVTDPHIVAPYNFVTMAAYERTFLTNLFVNATYEMDREIHRLRTRNLNAPRDITSDIPRSCRPGQTSSTCVRPFPDRGNILNLEPSASETVHNFRINYRQRFSRFSVSAGYLFAFGWADASPNSFFGGNNMLAGFGPEGLPTDSYNLAADWGRTGGTPHTVTNTVNARLPFGIYLTETMTMASGRHYTILTGKDDNQDTSVNDRPPGASRNGADATGSIRFDFNVSKAFFLQHGSNAGNSGTSTRANVNVFANMVNAFNRPNYNPPSNVMTSPNFGRPTSAGQPREFEVGLRFQF
jgi:hypothetical protein